MQNQKPKPPNPETAKILAVQKCVESADGKVLHEVLRKFCKPDEVRIPMDSTGKIDPLAVQYNEGKRSVIVHINALINKDLSKSKQGKAEIK